MTPKQVTTLDVKEIREIEIACDCGASLKFPVPLKNQLINEMTCLGCKRPLWLYGSPVYQRIASFLASTEAWCSLPQDEKHQLSLRFILTEKT